METKQNPGNGMRVEDGVTRYTRGWINGLRALRDMDPLSDIPVGSHGGDDIQLCPVARGINGWCDHEEYGFNRLLPAVGTLPPLVQTFVKEFDAGRYPQYEDNPT